eukprot:gene11977-biopygen5657
MNAKKYLLRALYQQPYQQPQQQYQPPVQQLAQWYDYFGGDDRMNCFKQFGMPLPNTPTKQFHPVNMSFPM